jgi:DNA-binding HxlR family transcriptional regulator
VVESIKVSAVSRAGLSGGVFDPSCPSRVLLDHVTRRWGVLVLVALSNGTMRWGEIRRWVQGVTEKMLAQTLRTLQADGLIDRHAYPEVPPRVDYSLTAHGRELVALLVPLVDWVTAAAAAADEDA